MNDERGSLTFGQETDQVPFSIKRYFSIFNVPAKQTRGHHAHKATHQFLVCLSGSCEIEVDNGTTREKLSFTSPSQGLHVPPMNWVSLSKFAPHTVLLVLTSDVYLADDYIRDYEQFVKMVKGK